MWSRIALILAVTGALMACHLSPREPAVQPPPPAEPARAPSAGPGLPMQRMLAQAPSLDPAVLQLALEALGYTSAAEALGEKFHASPKLLQRLNPGQDLGLAAQHPPRPIGRDSYREKNRAGRRVTLTGRPGEAGCRNGGKRAVSVSRVLVA